MGHSIDMATPTARAKLRDGAPVSPNDKICLIGLPQEAIQQHLLDIGVPQKQVRMRASQIWHWLYIRGISDFDAMGNIARPLKQSLGEHFSIARPELCQEQNFRGRYPKVAFAVSAAWRRQAG